uniref:Secreted protein n=1 Tax=Salmonella phage PMBT21 TaxID=3153512 RepID=A0AAU8GLP7_9CAUD
MRGERLNVVFFAVTTFIFFSQFGFTHFDDFVEVFFLRFRDFGEAEVCGDFLGFRRAERVFNRNDSRDYFVFGVFRLDRFSFGFTCTAFRAALSTAFGGGGFFSSFATSVSGSVHRAAFQCCQNAFQQGVGFLLFSQQLFEDTRHNFLLR